jgi:hypothetical protein
VRQARADGDGAVAAHERDRPRPERARQRGADRRVAHEHVRHLARRAADVEDGHRFAQERAHVVEGPQRHAAHAERDDRRRVAVHDGFHVRPRAVDLAVDEPLDERRAPSGVDRLGIEVVLEDVGGGHELGRQRARHEIAVRIGGMAHAHVAVSVEDVLIDEDAVGRHEVVDELGVDGAGGGRRRLRGHARGREHRRQRQAAEKPASMHGLPPPAEVPVR